MFTVKLIERLLKIADTTTDSYSKKHIHDLVNHIKIESVKKIISEESLFKELKRIKIQRNRYEQELFAANRKIIKLMTELELKTPKL